MTHKEWDRIYYAGRREHAFLMRHAGETYKRIGERLGVSGTMANILILKFARRDMPQVSSAPRTEPV